MISHANLNPSSGVVTVLLLFCLGRNNYANVVSVFSIKDVRVDMYHQGGGGSVVFHGDIKLIDYSIRFCSFLCLILNVVSLF